MAEQKMSQSVHKIFEGIQFKKVEDRYTIKIDYNADSDSLSLQFINQTTKSIFEGIFDKHKLNEITSKCNVPPASVVKMIIDSLNSKELISKNFRIYILSNVKQATIKCSEIRALRKVPNAVSIASKYEPKSETTDEGASNNDNNMSLVFVLYFSAPPYIFCNYVFIVERKNTSNTEKIQMQVDALHKENQSLKQLIMAQQQQTNQLLNTVQFQSQQIQQLQKQMAELSQALGEEKKQDESGIKECKITFETKPRSLYNSGYYCDIYGVILSRNNISIHFQVYGNMSVGQLQTPKSSKLKIANVIKSVKTTLFYTYDLKSSVHGLLTYEYQNMHTLSLKHIINTEFQYGQSGYSFAKLFNSHNKKHQQFIADYLSNT